MSSPDIKSTFSEHHFVCRQFRVCAKAVAREHLKAIRGGKFTERAYIYGAGVCDGNGNGNCGADPIVHVDKTLQ